MIEKQLRIGSLVHFCNQKQIHKVSYIYCHFNNEIACENTVERDFSDFSAIKLTEEILLKLNARKIDHINGYSFWTFKRKNFNLNLDIYETYTQFNCYSIKHIEFVHQLQNFVFAATGSELDVSKL